MFIVCTGVRQHGQRGKNGTATANGLDVLQLPNTERIRAKHNMEYSASARILSLSVCCPWTICGCDVSQLQSMLHPRRRTLWNGVLDNTRSNRWIFERKKSCLENEDFIIACLDKILPHENERIPEKRKLS